jgi:hypothetical protein
MLCKDDEVKWSNSVNFLTYNDKPYEFFSLKVPVIMHLVYSQGL